MIRPSAALAAIVATLLFAVPANADFRTGNHWMSSRPAAERFLRVSVHATYAVCRGDSSGDYDINRGRGLYHHFGCALTVPGHPGGFFGVQLWVIGQDGNKNFRTTNISWHAA
jgi:hypothetical protein